MYAFQVRVLFNCGGDERSQELSVMYRPTRVRKARTMMPTRDAITRLSLILNALLAISLLLLGFRMIDSSFTGMQGKELTFHGGHPEDTKTGTCWCGHEDHYCMCTPSLAIDLVIASGKDHIWLVRRKDTDQLATMGGFVHVGETVEHAVARELSEEMGLSLEESPRLLGIYSDPRRDNRRHTVSAVFVVEVSQNAKPRAADDVKDVQRIRLDEIESHSYFADHKTILHDYRRSLGRNLDSAPIKDIVENVVRSTCHDL